ETSAVPPPAPALGVRLGREQRHQQHRDDDDDAKFLHGVAPAGSRRTRQLAPPPEPMIHLPGSGQHAQRRPSHSRSASRVLGKASASHGIASGAKYATSSTSVGHGTGSAPSGTEARKATTTTGEPG